MPVVLLTLAAIGAIAVSVISKGTAELGDARSFESRGRERLLLEAGLARGILALMATDDPITESLREHGSVDWTFAGQSLKIEMWSESAKLDLNSADPGALAVSLDRTVGPEIGSEALKMALSHRGTLSDPDQLLPLTRRFTSSGERLREVLTAYGGQVGVPDGMSQLEDGASKVVSNERPVYTLHSSVAGRSRTLAVTVLVEPEAHRYVILERRELSKNENTASQ